MRQKDQTKHKLLREITSLRGRISDLEESEKQREQLAREILTLEQPKNENKKTKLVSN